MDEVKEEVCPICKGSGWINYSRDGYDYARECECQALIKAKKRIMASGISEELLNKGFKGFDDRGIEVLKTAKSTGIRYCQKFPEIKNTRNNSILFMGQVGSGKTHLSFAICKAIMDFYKTSVVYMAYREEMVKLKQIVKDENNYKETIERFKQCPVLMIDDLLKGKTTEADVNILFEIINHRYINNLPMIISTEKTKDELLDFDEGTMSRIIEMSQGYQIEIIGKEYNYRLERK